LLSEVTGVAGPRYRFEVRNAAGGLTYARDWTTGRSTWWTPTIASTYIVTALVRSGSAGTPVQATATYVVHPKLSAVTVKADAVTAVPGTPITFTASATGGATVEYRPLIGYSGHWSIDGTTSWDQTRPWGPGHAWTFTPDKVGFYCLRVYARERGSTRYYDVTSADLQFEPVRSPVRSFTVVTNPATSATAGSTITIAAGNIAATSPQVWRFFAQSRTTGAWTLIREYGASSTASWVLPATPGAYDLYISVREPWETSPYPDLERKITFWVLAGQKVNAKDGAVLLYVPAGEFLMGTPESATYGHLEPEHPQRRVSMAGYWIMRDEVSVAQYRAFCTATGRAMPPAPSFYLNSQFWTSWTGLDSYPMVNVTWEDAHAYAAWAGLSLPTEAQWEKAARGTDGRLFPWGNTWYASYYANQANSFVYEHSDAPAHQGPWPVGSFATDTSPYGCRDMTGNVAEWCADWYAPYDPAAVSDPVGPMSAGTKRTIRGDFWADPGKDLYARAAARGQGTPTGSGGNVGFRCVCSE
jgi:formylglycine-generating enzyme required for sulfatase activity